MKILSTFFILIGSDMQYTLIMQLHPTRVQEEAMLATMQAFNTAANYVAEVAFTHETVSRVKLQTLLYEKLRAQFHLPSQLVVGAIGKACLVLQQDRNTKPVFAPDATVLYDTRVFSLKGVGEVSLRLLGGRTRLPFVVLGYQQPGRHALHVKQEQGYLLLRQEIFYLAVLHSGPLLEPGVLQVASPSFIDEDLGFTGTNRTTYAL
jgi:predicted transposase